MQNVFRLLVLGCLLALMTGCYTTSDHVNRTSSQLAHASSLREMINGQVTTLKGKQKVAPNDAQIQSDLRDSLQDYQEALALEKAESKANTEATRNAAREERERNRRGHHQIYKLDTDFFLKGEAETRQKKYDELWARYQDRAARL